MVVMNSYLSFQTETERLRIRAWNLEDSESAFKMYGDPEVARYLTGTPEFSLESQRENLEKIIAAYSKLDKGMGSFPIVLKDTDELVGAVLLKPLPRTEDLEAWRTFRDEPESVPPIHEIEIGWHLTRSAWGYGYATEAATALMEYGFQNLHLPEIHAVLYKENTKSWDITRRLGMDHIGSTDRFYGVTVEHFVKPKGQAT